MKEYRSSSQILFGYLPQQTVDLQGGVWKVTRWRTPLEPSHVDTGSLRRAIAQQAAAWRASGRDRGFVSQLEGQHRLRVYMLDRKNGVEVTPFPEIWQCKRCNRLRFKRDAQCPCGSRAWPGQLHFVGYHAECGALRQPSIPKCSDHNDVKIVFPGTASAAEIKFICPVCDKLLRKGFGQPNCECGAGRLTFNVHRATSVFSPQSIVIVNPPSTERINSISNAGGRARSLAWVLDGLQARTVEQAQVGASGLRSQLLAQGLDHDTVERMIFAAQSSEGDHLREEAIPLSAERREEAEREAQTVAFALSESRRTIPDLQCGSAPDTELGDLYRNRYPEALAKAGLETVDFVDDFPVLTGTYGYTRGDPAPGRSRLVPFRNKAGDYVVYGDLAETEALFIRLDPLQVARWLERQGFELGEAASNRDARIAVLENSRVPRAADEEERGEFGDAVLRLVHSYCHRFMRIAALHAGIDRNALAELLVPRHMGFFVYAAARGDFVLGGLQAVFESSLHRLLEGFVQEEHRCPLDPGCSNGGGACMACLHVGEPSCRYFNRFLDRRFLSGSNGYLSTYVTG